MVTSYHLQRLIIYILLFTLSGIHESNLYGAWYDPVDGIIDYLYTYPESGYGLSASNRISTDPDGDNITAI